MSDIPWIKIATSIFDNDKIKLIEAMPEADTIIVIWLKLIVHAGKINDDGYIFIRPNLPYSSDELATVYNRPPLTMQLALKTFQHFSMIELDSTGMIKIKNWEKYQNIEALTRIREQTRERVRAFRERKQIVEGQQARNATVTLRNGIDKNRIDKNRIEEEPPISPLKGGITFLEFYSKNELAYPGTNERIQSLTNRYKRNELSNANRKRLERFVTSKGWLEEFKQLIEQ